MWTLHIWHKLIKYNTKLKHVIEQRIPYVRVKGQKEYEAKDSWVSIWLCSALGGVLLIAGLYAYLWGKNTEVQNGAHQKSNPSKEEAHLDAIVTSKSPNVEQEKDSHQKIWSFHIIGHNNHFGRQVCRGYDSPFPIFWDVYWQLPLYFYVWSSHNID